jgi:Tfp pilus assembly protein PilX
MDRRNERGVALVITLFLMAALSALAVSLMFLSQTETSASRNYKTMSQARYAGEAGVHKAMNYLMSDTYTNTLAGTYGSLNPAVYPVQLWGGGEVVLTVPSTSSVYPSTGSASTVKPAFAALFSGPAGELPAGSATLKYTATAKLLSMQPINVYGSTTKYIQTWQITATGTVQNSLGATVDVTAILERDIVPAQSYSIFATGAGCGAIELGGTMHTDSYNSRAPMSGGLPVINPTAGGSVGTNGNLTIGGDVTVNGNLDTPRTGVGDCNAGTPTALTGSGHATVGGSRVQLPQAKAYPTPDAPSPTPPQGPVTTIPASSVGCDLIIADNPLNAPSCSFSGNDITVFTNGPAPLLMGNHFIGSNVNLIIQYGTGTALTAGSGVATVNVNSLKLGSNAMLTIGTNTSVTMNVAGTALPSGTLPLDFQAGGFANASFDASKLQILYGGTGTIEMIGGPNAAATIYAPNARVVMEGNADFYGSILSKTYYAQGDASVHYDVSLQSNLFTLGNWVMSSFSWKKY